MRAQFLIIYKSGATVKVKADKLIVTRNIASGEITKLDWANMKPRPLALGINEVSAVWEL